MSETPITKIEACGHHACWSCGECIHCDMCDCFWERPYAPTDGTGYCNDWVDYGKSWAMKERKELRGALAMCEKALLKVQQHHDCLDPEECWCRPIDGALQAIVCCK